MFLGALSGGLVGLGLVATATGVGAAFSRHPFQGALPVRSFPSYKGRRNFPGLWWSPTMGVTSPSVTSRTGSGAPVPPNNAFSLFLAKAQVMITRWQLRTDKRRPGYGPGGYTGATSSPF